MKTLFSALVLFLVLAASVMAQDINPYNIGPNGTAPIRATVNLKSTTTQSIVAAQGSGVRSYITQLQCVNPEGTADLIVNVYNGGATSGAAANEALIVYRLPCDSGLNGNNVMNFIPAIRMSAATAVNVGVGTTSPSGDKGIYVFINGFTYR